MQTPHHQQEIRPMNFQESQAFAVKLIQLVVHAWACNIYPFTRIKFGRRFWGIWELFAPAAMLVFVRDHETAMQMQCFFYVWLFFTIVCMFTTCSEYKGGFVHTRYDGYPRICNWFKVSEKLAKTLVEPALVFGAGLLCFLVLPSFGAFICISAVMCSLDYGIAHEQTMRRVREMRDAEIEQSVMNQMYEEYYRKGR